MVDYCYHTHTTRCGHAHGTEEEYVQAAIKAGIKVLGFSDHVFLPELPQPGMRGSYSLLNEYISTIRALKEKYKDQIEIFVGFEAEYGKCYEDYYRQLLESHTVDYLIQGQHLIFKNRKDINWVMSLTPFDALNQYTEQIIKGIASGLFKYVAHPDFVFRCFRSMNDELYKKMEEICQASVKYDVPLEINMTGLKYPPRNGNMNYSNEEFWKIAGKYGCKVIVGVDAHSPENFTDSDFDFADRMIKTYNLKEIKRLRL